MVGTDTGTNNIFRLVEQIHIDDIKNQAHRYFGLLGIENTVDPLPSPLTLSHLTQLSNGTQTQSVETFYLFDRMCSDTIAKTIEVSITKTFSRDLGFILGYTNIQILGVS